MLPLTISIIGLVALWTPTIILIRAKRNDLNRVVNSTNSSVQHRQQIKISPSEKKVLCEMKSVIDGGQLYVNKFALSRKLNCSGDTAYRLMENLYSRSLAEKLGWEFTLSEKGTLAIQDEN